jgi:hypothetical protein
MIQKNSNFFKFIVRNCTLYFRNMIIKKVCDKVCSRKFFKIFLNI